MALISNTVPDLTLVILVFNNASTLEKLYHQVRLLLEGENISFEMLFVNEQDQIIR